MIIYLPHRPSDSTKKPKTVGHQAENGVVTINDEHHPGVEATVLAVTLTPAKGATTVAVEDLQMKACFEPGREGRGFEGLVGVICRPGGRGLQARWVRFSGLVGVVCRPGGRGSQAKWAWH